MDRSPRALRAPNRRDVLHALGLGAASLPLLACDSSDPGHADPDARTGTDGSLADADPSCMTWAMGGTVAMTAQASYPDPFATPIASCPLVVCATTAGPCTANAPARKDVSEGFPGLPVRLALKVVTHTTCAPVVGAVVRIWHTQIKGVYSGITPAPGFCSGGDADAPNHSYFRGTQTTDANGRVDFDTCFPGWYPGRAIHIHFRVTVNNTSYLVSQLFFDQALVDDIFDCHPEYRPYGAPDTTNASDGVIGGGGSIAQYTCDTAKLSDGAMLASKVIALRTAGDSNCTT